MILVIDNYDSFTYNLVQYLGELGADVRVRRNDQVTLGEVEAMAPEQLLISPGPGRPENAGITTDVIRRFGPKTPILGVCLGHQAITRLRRVVEPTLRCTARRRPSCTMARACLRDQRALPGGRYHSLVIGSDNVPADLEVAARTQEDGTIMAGGTGRTVHGVQFHPESVLTGEGRKILRNFLDL